MNVMKRLLNKYTDINVIERVSEKYVEFTHHISAGTANSLISIFIISITIYGVATTISENKVAIANAQVRVAEIEARSRGEVMKYTSLGNEVRTAINNPRQNTPVNVYIDTASSNYIIESSDAATEVAISTVTVKGTKYTSEQTHLMTTAFHVGKEVGFPETIQSLLLQETRAGAYGDRIGDLNLPTGKRSYGVMQIKVATARKVLNNYKKLVPEYFPTRKTYKRLRDEEIIVELIKNDEFNIRLAALNFALHRKRSKNWSHAVVAYNTGQRGANAIVEHKKHVYYGHIVKRLISEVRPFNREAKLTL